MNLGIIGLGNQGKIHLRNSLRMKGAKLVGVADTSQKALEYAKMKGIKSVYTNYEDLLKNKELDAVIISLPNFLHSDVTINTSEAGKDILLEKPLARNVQEGEKIVSSCKKNGVELMVGYPSRFNPVLNRIHDEIGDGLFGDVRIAEATNVSSGPFGARGDRMGPSPVPSWWFDKELVGGGALLDLGSHLINLLTWYFGEVEDVKSYLSYMFRLDLEDTATCVLHFKSGPVATIKAGWFSKEIFQSVEICGTARSILVQISPLRTRSKIWKDITKKLGWSNNDLFFSELSFFVDCLRNDQTLHPSGEEALSDLRIIAAAYEGAAERTEETSVREGRS